MKQLVSKLKQNTFYYFRDRIFILKASIVYTFQIETAYFFNNWGNIISTTLFTVTYVIFADAIFSNAKTIAGYSRDEMMFFILISQLWFYIFYSLFQRNVDSLIENVNSGNLDLILTKPMPTSFYINFNEFNILSVVRDGLIPFGFVVSTINWVNITIHPINLILGFMILMIGTFITNAILFSFALIVFWVGESSSVIGTVLELEDNSGHRFPLEGYGDKVKTIMITAIPFGISAGLSTSVILGRSEPGTSLLISLFVLLLFSVSKEIFWRIALRNYTSASS